MPARFRKASEASVMPCADPKIASALERVGTSSAGARVSVAQAKDSSLGGIARIIGRAPWIAPPEKQRQCADLPEVATPAIARAKGRGRRGSVDSARSAWESAP